jgi:hypothetical protein
VGVRGRQPNRRFSLAPNNRVCQSSSVGNRREGKCHSIKAKGKNAKRALAAFSKADEQFLPLVELFEQAPLVVSNRTNVADTRLQHSIVTEVILMLLM